MFVFIQLGIMLERLPAERKGAVENGESGLAIFYVNG